MNLIKKNITLVCLILILIFAFIIRIYRIDSMPVSMNWDEVSLGYNAFSIAKSGIDEWGNKFPVLFRAYGDYKLPLYIYLTSAIVKFFGLSVFTVRVVSLFSGLGIVLFTYLLCNELIEFSKITFLVKNKKSIILVSAFLVAIEPWTFFLSRVALEANLSNFLIILGLYFIFRSINTKLNKFLFLGVFFMISSMWAYNSARVFVPLMFFGLFFIFYSNLKIIFTNSKYRLYILLSLILISFLFLGHELFSLEGQSRYRTLQLVDVGVVSQIIDFRLKSNLPNIVERLVFNRPVFFGLEFVKNYLIYLNPNYLFINGGTQYQFNIPNFGQLYFPELVTVLISITILIKNFKNRVVKFLFYWFLIAFIPASLTKDAPHALRSFVLVPLPMFLSAIGIVYLLKFKKVFFYIFLIILFGFFIRYLSLYFGDYKMKYSQSWQYGYKELVEYSLDNKNEYDKIFVTKKYGEPHEFFYFYERLAPTFLNNDQNLVRYGQSDWFWVDSFDKYVFLNDWQIPKEGSVFKTEKGFEYDCANIKCLIATSQTINDLKWKLITEIRFLDGKIAFYIYENI